ncbi:hypothetical protein ALQ60_200231 [Pseudomonas syringae pv. papulans]|nr:hypothetical protein ALQ60_200231 [Pseudomonas syringae pv. papulans]RMN56625.1 hypothetical protein ALQ56_200133 [Pseudomonas syringae pv. papulans]RMV35584.1 hypothetical protein ALP11_200056 [Pseudomonas syringae pv. papulans]
MKGKNFFSRFFWSFPLKLYPLHLLAQMCIKHGGLATFLEHLLIPQSKCAKHYMSRGRI